MGLGGEVNVEVDSQCSPRFLRVLSCLLELVLYEEATAPPDSEDSPSRTWGPSTPRPPSLLSWEMRRHGHHARLSTYPHAAGEWWGALDAALVCSRPPCPSDACPQRSWQTMRRVPISCV